MPGLNRGNSFKFKKQLPIGVVFSDKINLWLVRVLKKGVPTTLGKFSSEEKAKEYHDKYTQNTYNERAE